VWGKEEVYTAFWWGHLGQRVVMEDPDVDRKIILKWFFRM